MAPYLGSLAYQSASNADEFVSALKGWGAPGVNQVFATSEGHIGWQACGVVPRRQGWDGSLPVPGDGRYEWQGFSRGPDLPGLIDPPEGWLQTANEMNLPLEYRTPDRVPTYDWYSTARAERLQEWLGQTTSSSVADSVAMQSDTHNLHAGRIIDLLRHVPEEGIAESELLAELRIWDGDMSVQSRAALVFEVWSRRFLRPALTRHHLVTRGVDAVKIDDVLTIIDKDESFGGDLRGELRMLDALRASESVASATSLVDSTLSAAAGHLNEILGPDRDLWVWGAVHHTLLTNAAFAEDRDVPESWARLGPSPRAGNGDTVANAGYDVTFRQTIGSTFRVVVDVGDWDQSRVMNAPGQSGDPRSPHYSDHFDDWIEGGSFPLLFSRTFVEAHVARRLVLRPVHGGE